MFLNGRLPARALKPIPGGRLRRDAAKAWNAMHAEILRKEKLDICPTGARSSYRTVAEQQQLRAEWCAQGKCENAAVPGTSNHGWGVAVDVATMAMRAAIDKHGAKYGWAKQWSDAPHEWWHLKYRKGPFGKLLRQQRRAERRKRRRRERRRQQRMQLSNKGAAFIGAFEGFVDHPYNDPVGHCTVGYGHLIHEGNCTAHDRATWGTISRDRGLRLLQDDATRFEDGVRHLVKVPLNQHEFDALVSFSFNLGLGALRESTLLRKLNAGERASVPAEMARWDKAGGRTLPGLTRRRRAEGRLFAHGDYSTK